MAAPSLDLDRLFAPVAQIDAYLTKTLDQPMSHTPPNLQEAMKYAVLQGGKRLRPLLAWYCCEACGAPGKASLVAGAALEFVHAFSLVHDDLPALDNDDLRRGKPTLHKHAGEAMAILAGDALLNLAYQHIAWNEADIDPISARMMMCHLSMAVSSMISGQVLDTLGGFKDSTTPEERVRTIHFGKTESLIVAAGQLGIESAMVVHGRKISWNGPESKRKNIQGYVSMVGRMFQILDDLLDVEQTADETGKRTGKDAAAGKLTYPMVFGVTASRAEVVRLKAEALKEIEALGPAAQPLRDLCEYLSTRTR